MFFSIIYSLNDLRNISADRATEISFLLSANFFFPRHARRYGLDWTQPRVSQFCRHGGVKTPRQIRWSLDLRSTTNSIVDVRYCTDR